MKAAINLVGVSYSTSGRIRNFNESYKSLKKNIENPIREKGYDIDYFLTTYDSDKKEDIINLYNPVKSTRIVPCSGFIVSPIYNPVTNPKNDKTQNSILILLSV